MNTLIIIGLALFSECNLCLEFCCPIAGSYTGLACNHDIELEIVHETDSNLRIDDYFSLRGIIPTYDEHDKSCTFSGEFILVSEINTDTMFVQIETEEIEDNILSTILMITLNGESSQCDIEFKR